MSNAAMATPLSVVDTRHEVSSFTSLPSFEKGNEGREKLKEGRKEGGGRKEGR
jgi:hypothetical protein